MSTSPLQPQLSKSRLSESSIIQTSIILYPNTQVNYIYNNIHAFYDIHFLCISLILIFLSEPKNFFSLPKGVQVSEDALPDTTVQVSCIANNRDQILSNAVTEPLQNKYVHKRINN